MRRGELDPRAAAQSVVAQPEGQVLFAKLYNDTSPLGTLRGNRPALPGAEVPAQA